MSNVFFGRAILRGPIPASRCRWIDEDEARIPSMIKTPLRPALWMAMGLAVGPGQGEIQAAMMSGESKARHLQPIPQSSPPDSSDLLGVARRAQSRFERRRRATLPWTPGESGHPCDNRVGRFCQWHDEDSGWRPIADTPEVVRLREGLLAELSELSVRIPGDRWILGQRIFYLAEAGRWGQAMEVAGACGVEPTWWCDVLLGFAQHGAGRYGPAMSSFRRGLSGMDPKKAREWRYPEVLLDGRAKAVMNDAADEEWELLRARFWILADPLYLMSGNDRETEHYARWTYSEMSDRARSPRGVPWGSDLEELTVRYGWDRGWERRRPSVGSLGQESMTVGHDLPGTREFVPPGVVLERPWLTDRGSWLPKERPREAHVAAYSPDLDPGVGQVAVFHRGDSILVAAATRLPERSDHQSVTEVMVGEIPSAEPEGPLPWAQPEFLDQPAQVGLFLIDPENGLREARRFGESEGVLALSAPAGRYLMSLEAWAPDERRAGRIRLGLVTDSVPQDLATLSDLIILDPVDTPPARLDQALPLMRPSLELVSGQPLAVGWEIFGLGWREERVDFELSVSEEGEGVLERVGRWLGLGGGDDEPLQIGWSEPGPGHTGPWFRSVNVDLPELEAGEYLLRLEVSVRGREPLVRTRAVQILR